MNRIRWCPQPVSAVIHLFLTVTSLLVAPSGGLRAQEEASTSVAGTYRDEQVQVEIATPTRSGDTEIYTGTIQLGAQKFPLRAEGQEGRLKGYFESQGDRFEFTGSIVGRMFVLTTDGTTYRLKKQSSNPLARTSKPNPLAQTAPRSNPPPVASHLANPITSYPTNAPPRPVAHSDSSTLSIQLKPFSVFDNPDMIGGEAFSLLAPPDWKIEGGVGWRMYPSAPAYVAMRVSDPSLTEVWQTFPTIPFVWADGGAPDYPPGSKYLGNEVAEPIENPVDYVTKVILPRFRRELTQPQIVATEDLPRVAELIKENAQEPGVEKKFRATRVRLEYLQGGKVMQEDFYCVLALAYAPAIKTTLWGPERNYSFRAEKGKLDARTQVFQTMVDSFRPNLRWFNRYAQLIRLLLQSKPDTDRPAGELNLYIGRTNDDVDEARRALYEQQERSAAKINAAFGLYIRAVEDYRSPFRSAIIQLPAGYRQAWAHPLGEFALSDDPSFNPNLAADGRWLKLEKFH